MGEDQPPTPPGGEPEPPEPEDETVLPPPLPPELRELGVLARIRRHALDLSPMRQSKDFRLLFLGQSVSEFGSQLTFVALPFQIYAITGSTLAVGLIGLCELVPLLVLPIVGGAIADAVERTADAPHRPRAHRPPVRRARLERTARGAEALGAVPVRVPGGRRVRPLLAGAAGVAGTAAAGGAAAVGHGAGGDDVQHRAAGRAGAGRGADRRRGPRGRVHDRRRHVPRRLRVDRGHAAVAPDGGARGDRPRVGEGGPPVPARQAGAAGHVLGRHQRDGVRDADGAVPGVRGP